MISLYDSFSTLKESYYNISIDPVCLFSDSMSDIRCYNFINEHFIKGKKKKVFSITDEYMDAYKENGKHRHTVSLYLMGLYFKDIFDISIKKGMSNHFCICGWQDFEYSWYLTCLYHDVVSCVEKIGKEYFIKNDLFSSNLFIQYKDLLRFDKEIYEKYYDYRNKRDRVDHGIAAGIKLFDSLEKSFNDATNGHRWSENATYRHGNLYWRQEHLPHFAYIADAVCCHNIWLVNANDKEKSDIYTDNGLGQLVVHKEEDKLQLSEYPLQYLLCLLDTIELTKRFRNLDAKGILENVYIQKQENSIKIGWTSLIKSQPEFFRWYSSIMTLSEWMGIIVGSCFHKDDLCCLELKLPV